MLKIAFYGSAEFQCEEAERLADKKVGGRKDMVTTAIVLMARLSDLVALPKSVIVRLSR